MGEWPCPPGWKRCGDTLEARGDADERCGGDAWDEGGERDGGGESVGGSVGTAGELEGSWSTEVEYDGARDVSGDSCGDDPRWEGNRSTDGDADALCSRVASIAPGVSDGLESDSRPSPQDTAGLELVDVGCASSAASQPPAAATESILSEVGKGLSGEHGEASLERTEDGRSLCGEPSARGSDG